MTLKQLRAVFPIFLRYCLLKLLFLIPTSYLLFSLFPLGCIFRSGEAVIRTGFHRLNWLFLITTVIMMLWWAARGRRWWFLALGLWLFLLLFLIAVSSRVILFFLWWLGRLFVGGYLLNLIAIYLGFKILFLYLYWWFFWFDTKLVAKLGKLFWVVKLGVLVYNYDGLSVWHS